MQSLHFRTYQLGTISVGRYESIDFYGVAVATTSSPEDSSSSGNVNSQTSSSSLFAPKTKTKEIPRFTVILIDYTEFAAR